MDSVFWLNLAVFLFFLLLSGFFSSSETAFTAANQIKLRNLVTTKPRLAKRIQFIYRSPKRLLTGILLGNNLANVAATTFATAVLLDLFRSSGLSNAWSLGIITVFITIALLIIGEITPKTLALKHPETTAILYSRPIHVFLLFFAPIIKVFEWITKGLTWVLRASNTEDQSVVTLEEIKVMMEMGNEEGVIEPEKTEMLTSIFEFSDTVVREIMTPRTDAVCMNVNSTIRDVIELITDKGHSRIPVYEEKVDNILGIVYAKDLLNVSMADRGESVRRFMRECVFIPESKNIEMLLQQMKRAKFHIAIVVDEYGGMAGLVTLEDIIEEIIGEIQDEYDQEESELILDLGEGRYLADAAIHIDTIGHYFGIEFPETDDYDTLGGFTLSLFGKFPAKGEEVQYNCLNIRVKDIRKRRLLKLEIFKAQSNSEACSES